MTKTDRRLAIEEMGVTALFTTDDPDVATEGQRDQIARYIDWLSDRYAADVSIELSVEDDATWIVTAQDDAGRYAAYFPRSGSAYAYAPWEVAVVGVTVGLPRHRVRSVLDFHRSYFPWS